MNRPYRVKAPYSIEDQGVVYESGRIVYLSREDAQYHGASIEPAFDLPGDPAPPFEAELVAHVGQDLKQIWYVEQYSIDIVSIVVTSLSTITCKKAHQLVTGQKINIRILSPTIGTNLKTVATVTGSLTLTVPETILLPEDFDVAEIGVPVNLNGSTFNGGIYNYSPNTFDLIFEATAKTVSGSKRITLTGLVLEELNKLRVSDTLQITGAVAIFSVVKAVSETKQIGRFFERSYLLTDAATATIETDQVIGQRTEPSQQIGSLISGKQFTFGGNALYGEIIAQIDSAALNDLVLELYPFKVGQISGSNDTVLFVGTIEVVR